MFRKIQLCKAANRALCFHLVVSHKLITLSASVRKTKTCGVSNYSSRMKSLSSIAPFGSVASSSLRWRFCSYSSLRCTYLLRIIRGVFPPQYQELVCCLRDYRLQTLKYLLFRPYGKCSPLSLHFITSSRDLLCARPPLPALRGDTACICGWSWGGPQSCPRPSRVRVCG